MMALSWLPSAFQGKFELHMIDFCFFLVNSDHLAVLGQSVYYSLYQYTC